MTISIAKTIGFCEQFRQLLQERKAELKSKGLDVTDWITEMESLTNEAVTDINTKMTMEAALRTHTKKMQTSVKTAYDTASSRLDVVVGLLDKKTLDARQAARLRSSVIKKYKKKKSEQESK